MYGNHVNQFHFITSTTSKRKRILESHSPFEEESYYNQKVYLETVNARSLHRRMPCNTSTRSMPLATKTGHQPLPISADPTSPSPSSPISADPTNPSPSSPISADPANPSPTSLISSVSSTIGNKSLHESATFTTFTDFQRAQSKYEESHFRKLYTRRSRTIKSALKRAPNKQYNSPIKFTEMEIRCIHGGKKFRSTGTGKRPNQM